MLLILSWAACSIFFSTSYIGANFLTKYSVPLEYTIFYRMIVSVIILAVIVFVRRDRFLIKKSEIFPSILVSISQLSVWLGTYGAKYLISGLVPCVTLLQIFVAELLSSIVERRKMRRNIIVSGCLGFIGIIMLCNQQFVDIEDIGTKNTIIGIAFSFASTFAAAGGNIVYEKSEKTLLLMPRSTFIFYNCFFAGMFLLLIGIIVNPVDVLFDVSVIDNKYLFIVAWLSLTSTIIALFALYYIIEKQGAVVATYMNFILPIISMAISTVVEGFTWNITAVLGMIILLYSVWIGTNKSVV